MFIKTYQLFYDQILEKPFHLGAFTTELLKIEINYVRALKYLDMKIRFIFFASISLLLLGCQNQQEAKIIDFLNKHQETFDKKTFELVELKVQDTLFVVNEQYLKLAEFSKIGNGFDAADGVDQTDSGVIFVDHLDKSYNVKLGSYTDQLFNFILTNEFEIERGVKNRFLKDAVSTERIKFEKKLIQDLVFQDKLKSQISRYSVFTGAFSADSLNYYLAKEIEQRKKVIGYIYSIKYRQKNILQRVLLIFNPNGKDVLGYKFVSIDY